MSMLYTRQPRIRKPPVSAARIDWSNPITRGLQCAFAMAEGVGPPRCSNTGPATSSANLPAWTPSISGRAPLYTSSPTVTTRVPFASQTVGNLTLACWMRVTVSGTAFSVALTSTSSNNPIVGLTHNQNNAAPGTIQCWWRNDAGTQWRVDTARLPYNDGNWYHVVCTFSTATQAQVYVNGVNVSLSWPLTAWPITGTTTVDGLCLGSLVRTTSASYDIAVDQAMFWNRLLTEGEITALYLKPWQVYAPSYGPPQFGSAAATTTYFLWPGYAEECLDVLTY